MEKVSLVFLSAFLATWLAIAILRDIGAITGNSLVSVKMWFVTGAIAAITMLLCPRKP